jgi:hypothetical protein
MLKPRVLVAELPPKEPPLMKWEELAVYGEPDTSAGYMVLRRQFNEAMSGNLPAIKVMLKMIKANEAARKKREEYDSRRALPADRYEFVTARLLGEERRGDPALLLLGIGVISNSAMRRMAEPDEPGYENELRALGPTHIASWVLDWAMAREDCPDLSDLQLENVRARVLSEDGAETSEWRERKDDLLSQITALRGPNGARFSPGQSGNRRGRPRKKTGFGYPEDDPMGSFFDEVMTTTVHGEEKAMSRLDALLFQLTVQAARGDNKVGALLGPRIIEALAGQWESRFEPEPIYELRY